MGYLFTRKRTQFSLSTLYLFLLVNFISSAKAHLPTTNHFTCNQSIQIAASSDQIGTCTAPAFQIAAPDTTGVCVPNTIQLTAISIPLNMLRDANNSNVSLPFTLNSTDEIQVLAGLEWGTYTATFQLTDCTGANSFCNYQIEVFPVMTCNDHTVLTLGSTCNLVVTADMILESTCADNDHYTVEIEGYSGALIESPGTYTVTVEYTPTLFGGNTTPPIPSGYTCWGTVLVEDKTGAACILEEEQINVFCTEPFVEANPIFTDCTGVGQDTIQFDIEYGECSTYENQNFAIPTNSNGLIAEFSNLNIPFPINIPTGFDLDHVRVRNWRVADVLGNEGLPCQQYFYHWRPTTINAPATSIVVDCGAGTDPEGLASIDHQYVPNFINPNFGVNTQPDNDMPLTAVDNNENTEFLPILSLSHEVCKYSISYEDQLLDGFCGTGTKIIREWIVLNWCTGTVNRYEQIIEQMDLTAPNIVCAADITITGDSGACFGTVVVPNFTATDNCSDTLIYTNHWAFGSSQNSYNNVPFGTHPLTLIATDNCGNADSCIINITVEDIVAPVAVCELITQIAITDIGNTTICADNIDSGSYDNCGGITKALSIMGSNEFSSCLHFECTDVLDEVQIILQVTDTSGLTNQCMVQVNIVDMIPPQIECPNDVTLDCSFIDASPAVTGFPIIFDNCETTESFEDEILLNNCNVGEILRTWMVSDNFGNTATCLQTISVEDTQPPLIQFANDTTLFCMGIDDDFGMPIIEDNCSLYSTAFVDSELVNEPCLRKIQRTWIVHNECTDEEIAQNMLIKIELDEDAPVFDNPPTDILDLTCGDVIPPIPTVTATDACSENVIIEFSETTESGTCIFDQTITRTWTATDDCGNVATYQQTVQISDAEGPTLAGIPDVTIDCNDPIPADQPILTDNCFPPNTLGLSLDLEPIEGDCIFERTFVRTWTSFDPCGNTTVVVQNIAVTDLFAPTFFNIPEDITIGCEATVPMVITPGVSDNCSVGIVPVFSEAGTIGDCMEGTVVTRTWTATDDCGNVSTATQNITIIDELPPVFVNQAPDLTIGCDDPIPTFDAVATDDCTDNVTVVLDEVIDGTNCDMAIVRTWTATDECGNSTVMTQTIAQLDVTPPTLSNILNIDTDLADDCSAFFTLPTPTPNDNCTDASELDVIISIDFYIDGIIHDSTFIRNDTTFTNGSPTGIYPLGRHRIDYSVTDHCGNVGTAMSFITLDDITDPTVECISIDVALNFDGTVAVDVESILNLSATFDNCTAIDYQFADLNPTLQLLGDTLIFDCDSLGANEYTVYVEDSFGNYTLCSNIINIIDPPNFCNNDLPKPIISGKIHTTTNMPIAGNNIVLEAENNQMVSSNDNGIYIFEDIEIGSNCFIQPQSPNDYLNGVSTFDLVLIQQHILGINEIESPYKLIAADINNNNSITTADVVALRQSILYLQPEFPNNNSWKYLDANYIFENEYNPFEEVMKDNHFCQNITESHLNLDFIGIKIGDIDGSISNSIDDSYEQRNTDDLSIRAEIGKTQTEVIHTVDFYVDNFVDNSTAYVGLQFTLEWNPELVSVQPTQQTGIIQENNFGWKWIKDGLLTCSWNSEEALQMDELLFQLDVSAHQSINLNDVFTVSSRFTKAQAFDKNGHVGAIQLLHSNERIETATTSTTNIAEHSNAFKLSQNRPNPFSHQTNIQFELENDAITSIQVINMAGQLVYQQQIDGKRGINTVQINNNMLPETGVYIYQLQNKFGMRQKKMILVQ